MQMRTSISFFLIWVAAASLAYGVELTANDVMGASSFNSAGNWSSGTAPVYDGSAYVTMGYLLRTPATAGSYTFEGYYLVVGGSDGGGDNPFLTDGTTNSNCLLNKTPSGAIITVPSLYLDRGYIRDGMGNDDVWTIEGNILVSENGGGLANQCRFNVNAVVSGRGTLYIADNGNGDPRRTIYWNNPYNDYAGTIQLLGPAPDRCRLTFAPGSRMNFNIGPYGMTNQITGMGTAVFEGNFYFNLYEASTTVGDSWVIASAAAQSFGPSFAVAEFTPMPGGLWMQMAPNGACYVFDTNTGVLTVAQPISVITPNGGEHYAAGQPLQITYTTSPQFLIDAVDISIYGDGYVDYAIGVPNTGTFEWIAPYIESPNCSITVWSSANYLLADTSDSPFVVYQCPAAIAGDVNEDCYVNLQDLALLAQSWLLCGDKFNPACTIY